VTPQHPGNRCGSIPLLSIDVTPGPERIERLNEGYDMTIGKQPKAAPPTDKAHPIACRLNDVPRIGEFNPVDSGRASLSARHRRRERSNTMWLAMHCRLVEEMQAGWCPGSQHSSGAPGVSAEAQPFTKV